MSNSVLLITLDVENSPVYLTTAQSNVSYDGKTFIGGKAKVDKAIVQKAAIERDNFNFKISAVDQTMISVFANNNYKNRTCTIEELFYTDSYAVDKVELVSSSTMNNYKYSGSPVKAEITLNLLTIVGSFRKIGSIDLSVAFAEYINDDQTLYWGKRRPAGTGSSGGSGIGDEDLNPPVKLT